MAKSTTNPKWNWDTIASSPVLLLGAIYLLFSNTNQFIHAKFWKPFIGSSVLATICKIFVGILVLLILFFIAKVIVHAMLSGLRKALSKSVQGIFDWIIHLLVVLTVGFGIYYGIIHGLYLYAIVSVASILLFTSFIQHLKALFFAK